MQKIIRIAKISGIVAAPTSKSIAQRALVAAMLCTNQVELRKLTFCDDTLQAIGLADFFAKRVERVGHTDLKIIRQNCDPNSKTVNCGESGLLSRIMLSVAGAVKSESIITGFGSLLERPFDIIFPTLQTLGISVPTSQSKLPILLKGRICGGAVTVDGSLSSQFITGLLFALPLAKEDSQIVVHGLMSKPYVDMTIQVLQNFNIHIEQEKYKRFLIKGGQRYAIKKPYDVEGDWSAASCLLVAGAVGGHITVKNLNSTSLQGDKEILKILRQAGVKMSIENNEVSVYKSEILPFDCDASDTPDLFPALVVLAIHSKGICRIHGISRLRYKESNRAEVLQNVFRQLGITIHLINDTMEIFGGTIRSTVVSSYNDHRIAMALAIAGIGQGVEVVIDGAECVAKSYPEFWQDLDFISQ